MNLNEFFGKELKVVNIGLRSFAEDLEKQDKRVIQVDWRPAAGGDEKLQSILERMRKKK